jgi:hypothetical protein
MAWMAVEATLEVVALVSEEFQVIVKLAFCILFCVGSTGAFFLYGHTTRVDEA